MHLSEFIDLFKLSTFTDFSDLFCEIVEFLTVFWDLVGVRIDSLGV